MTAGVTIAGRCLAPGEAAGETVVLDAPLSLWGGFDPAGGRIIDVHHPQHGLQIGGRIVVMPGGRGSSSSASVLLEAVRLGRHPRALVLGDTDPVLVMAALVAADLYGAVVPVIRIGPEGVATVPAGARATVTATAEAAILKAG